MYHKYPVISKLKIIVHLTQMEVILWVHAVIRVFSATARIQTQSLCCLYKIFKQCSFPVHAAV